LITKEIIVFRMVLRAFYWNCGSGIVKKFDYFKDLAITNNLDAIFIAESDIRLDADVGFLSIDGYELILSNTLESRGLSRLICFKKPHLNQVKIDSQYDEVIALEKGDITVVGIYRAFKCYENESERTNFERLIQSVGKIKRQKEFYILGDFNIDIGKVDSRFKNDLIEWCDLNDLVCNNLGITRRRWVLESLQESAIDFVISNSPKYRANVEFNDLSDHAVIKLECLNFENVIRCKKKFTLRNWDFDAGSATIRLEELLSTSPIMFSSISELDYRIRASLITIMQEFVKRRDLTIRSQNDVTYPIINKLKNRRDRLRKKWSKSKLAIDYVNFIRASRQLRNEVRKVKRKVIKSKMEKGTKEFWHEINRLRGLPGGTIDKVVINGEETRNLDIIADGFIDFFTNKTNSILGNYTSYKPPSLLEMVDDFIPFTNVEILSAFKRLSNKKVLE